MKDFQVTDVQVFISEQKGYDGTQIVWYVNFAINDSFLLQYEPEFGFTIPHCSEMFWHSEEVQEKAFDTLSGEKLAEKLELPTTLTQLDDDYAIDLYPFDRARDLLDKMIEAGK